VLTKTAINSLLERPGRSALTMLGIIIGVASIYALLSIGNATKRTMLNSLDGAEGRTITITPKLVQGRQSQDGFVRPFSDEDIKNLAGVMGVEFASGQVQGTRTIISPTMDLSGSIVGGDEFFLLAQDISLAHGSNISALDMENSHAVAVLGAAISKRLYGSGFPLGETLKIDQIPFTIIGVTKPKGDSLSGSSSVNEFILIPRTTARKQIFGDSEFVRNKVDIISIIALEQSAIPEIEVATDRLLRRSRGLTISDPPDFQIFSIGFVREIFAVMLTTLTVLLGSLGAISLFVGGVGVMNIMLVTVSERTREIGLRMALGAKPKQILTQFLIEAIFLCMIASAIGLALGYGISLFVMNIGEMDGGFSIPVMFLSVGSAFFVGIIFGFWPAFRASKLSPIEALRHE